MTAFPGYPAYIAEARASLGAPHEAVPVARRVPPLHELSNLVAQALARPEGPHPDTVRRVGELADGLCIAAEAALLMRALVAPGRDDDAPAAAIPPAAREAAPVGMGRGRRNG